MRVPKVKHDCSLPPVVLLPLLVLVLAALASPAAARVCTVPGTYSTIRAAADDGTCTEIRLTLAAYTESVSILRPLTLRGMTGQPVTLTGLVRVEGINTQVILENLAIRSGCPDTSLLVTGRATIEGVDLSALRAAALPCPPLLPSFIFTDGFESGNTSAWSTTVP